jgi:adenosylcobinamide-GDP ribazoletransferase
MLLFLIRFNTFKSSFVTLLKDSLSFNSLLFASIFTIVIGFILIGFKSLVLLFFAFCLSLIISKFIKNNLGFLNGDSLGMTLELTEIILFIVVCILWL